MEPDEEKLRQLAEDLRARLPARDSFNFVPVVVTPAAAIAVGRTLVEMIPAQSFDFDARAIDLMQEADWDRCLGFERASMLRPLRQKLAEATAQARQLVTPDRPVVVFNANLPVSMDFPELGPELYQASMEGLIVLCVGGSVRGDRVLLHHTLPVVGGGLVEPVDLTA